MDFGNLINQAQGAISGGALNSLLGNLSDEQKQQANDILSKTGVEGLSLDTLGDKVDMSVIQEIIGLLTDGFQMSDFQAIADKIKSMQS
jgi:hypothetical protein